MSTPVTKEDVGHLIEALNRLSVALERSSLASSTSSSTSSKSSPVTSIAGWELVEEETPTLLSVKLDPLRIFEDGPQPIPEDLLALASSKITSVVGNPKDRIVRAWRAGFWAWAANATHTEYTQADPISLSDAHWIVVRHSRLAGPIRVRKISELRSLLSSQKAGADGVIYQGFPSITEIQVFCSSLGTSVPPLYQCSGVK